jgi:hypothetical protein
VSDRLARNLQALGRRQPALVARLAAAAPDPSFRLVPGRDGSLVIARTQGERVTVLSHPEQAAAKAVAFADQRAAMLAGKQPLCFSGLRAGYEVREMHGRLRRRDFEPARGVYVVEPSLDMLRLNLTAHDWTEQLAADNLTFFSGEDAVAEFEWFFLADPAKPPPQQVVPIGAADQAREVLAALERVVATLSARVKHDRTAFAEFLAGQDPLELATAYLDHTRLRVLLINNKLSYFVQHSVRDMRQSLTRLGAEVRILEEDSLVDRMTGPLQIGALAEFRPHGVLFIDHARHEAADIYPPELPFFAFLQDFMQALAEPDAAAHTGPRDQFLGCVENLVHHPPGALFQVPAWADPETYAAAAEPPEPVADIGFVSNLTTHHEAAFAALHDHWTAIDGRLGPALDRIYERAQQLDAQGRMFTAYDPFRDWVLDVLREADCELDKPGVFAVDVYDRLINLMLRHQPLEWAAEAGYSLALWGRGWESHPRLGQFARGVAPNGPELAAIYRSVRVNLHVNQYSLEHPRILDGLLAGGFFLTRETASLGLLDLGDCFFADRAALLERLERFMPDRAARHGVVERNSGLIRQWATYEKGLRVTFTHFALRLVAQAVGETGLAKWTADLPDRAAARAALRELAAAYALDPQAFGPHAVVELLVRAGHLPPLARERLAELEDYETRWGSPGRHEVFGLPARAELAAALRRLLDEDADGWIALLADGWAQHDSPAALATRLVRFGQVDRTPDPAYCRALAVADLPALPIRRPTLKETELPPLARLRLRRRPVGKEALIADHEAEALTARGAFVAAWETARRLVDLTPTDTWAALLAGHRAWLAGDVPAMRELYARVENELAAAGETDRVAVVSLTTQSALVALAQGSMETAAEYLDCLTAADRKLEPARLVEARLHLCRGDAAKARGVLGDARLFSTNLRRAAAAGLHRLCDADGDPSHAAFGAPQVVFEKAVPLATLPDAPLRCDRAFPLPDGGLLLRCPGQGVRLVVLDPTTGALEPLGARLPVANRVGLYPAVTIAEEQLHLIDAVEQALVVCDPGGAVLETHPLPEPFGPYATEIVATAGGELAVADQYFDRYWIRDAAGAWRSESFRPPEARTWCELTGTPARVAFADTGDILGTPDGPFFHAAALAFDEECVWVVDDHRQRVLHFRRGISAK